jgi:hypothetical protein
MTQRRQDDAKTPRERKDAKGTQRGRKETEGNTVRHDENTNFQILPCKQHYKIMTENEFASLAVNICLKIHKQYGSGLILQAII